MSYAGILLVGVLALIAVLVVSAIIVATAPYLAAVIIVTSVCWWAFGRDDKQLGESSSAPTKVDPRE
jgi:hypothetical protein